MFARNSFGQRQTPSPLGSSQPASLPPAGRPWTPLEDSVAQCWAAATAEAATVLRDAIPGRVPSGTRLQGADAFDYLVSVLHELVASTTDLVAEYSSTTWFTAIRLLNPALLERLSVRAESDDFGALFRVAENLTSASAGTVVVRVADDTSDRRLGMRIARLFAMTDVIDRVEGMVRSATKGVQYLTRSRRVPSPVDSADLEAALRAFDVRNLHWSLARWQRSVQVSDDTDVSGDPTLLTAYRLRPGFARSPVWQGILTEATRVEGFAQFTATTFATGDPTHAVLGQGALSAFDDPEAVASLVIFGHCLLARVIRRDSAAGLSVPQHGSLTLDDAVLRQELRTCLSQAHVVSWLASHNQQTLTDDGIIGKIDGLFRPRERSYPGRVIHRSGSTLTIDVWAYSWHVSTGLRINPSAGGSLVNVSARAFEIATQRVVDATGFGPPPKIAGLRGTTLRLRGRSLTDIDAFIAIGTKLILVSCKRVTLKIDYLTGDYATTRNAATRVDEAVSEWADRLAELRASPKGDNYDFTGYDLDGIVVVPEWFSPRILPRRRPSSSERKTSS